MSPRFAAFLLATGLLAACGRSPAPTPPATVAFGGTDLAWIEISIAMDNQLLPLLKLPSTHTENATLSELSAQLQAAVTAELPTLNRLHDQAGLPSENPHEGMTMPGLIPSDAVTQAAALSGPAFDRAFQAQLKPYLEQSHRLAQDEQKAGTDPQTRALATRTATTRATALTQLPSPG